MIPAEEARSLNENPLPPVVIVDPLTRAWEIEKEIFRLNQQISELIREKTEALDYAVQHGIREDDRCYLKESIRRSRTLNAERFREVFPQEYQIACDIERKDLGDRLLHVGERVPLTLVDKLVKKPVLEAAQGVITVKENKTYEVVRK